MYVAVRFSNNKWEVQVKESFKSIPETVKAKVNVQGVKGVLPRDLREGLFKTLVVFEAKVSS
jgi:hypothetical protein